MKRINIFYDFSVAITSAMAEVMISGIGSVVSPIPSLINLACGFLWAYSDSRMDIWLRYDKITKLKLDILQADADFWERESKNGIET